jgi:hypothetical protein
MKKPDPQIGQIVRFDYLWRREAHSGLKDGLKIRPCAVIVARRRLDTGDFEVLLAPITHSPPSQPSEGYALPEQARPITGLDHQKSWLITSELNEVRWTDAGFTPARPEQWLVGQLPRRLAIKVNFDVLAAIKAGQMAIIRRS